MGIDDLQREGARVGARVHPRLGGLRHPSGALGRLRARLQDARHELHGVGALGLQDPARQGPRVRGLPRAALLLARRDAAVQPRAAHGRRRLQDAPGPVGDGHLPAHRRQGRGARAHRRARPRLDHDAVDAPDEPRARRRSRHPLRRRPRRPGGLRRRAPRSPTAQGPDDTLEGTAHRYLLAEELLAGYAKDLGYENAAAAREAIVQTVRRGGARGRHLRPTLRLLRGCRDLGHRERVAHPRRRLRDDRGRHRHRPPGPGLRRGRPAGHRGRRHPAHHEPRRRRTLPAAGDGCRRRAVDGREHAARAASCARTGASCASPATSTPTRTAGAAGTPSSTRPSRAGSCA